MKLGRLQVLWRGGFQLPSPSGIRGTVSTWAFTDDPHFRWWIVGSIEIRWEVGSPDPRSDDEIYEALGIRLKLRPGPAARTIQDPMLQWFIYQGLPGDTSRLPVGCRISADKKMTFLFGEEPKAGEVHVETAR